MSSVSFSRYAALVKNLRGVILADPRDGGVKEFLRWLGRRFRYRVLGAPPTLRECLSRAGLSLTKGIKPLHYPSSELRRLTQSLTAALGGDLALAVEAAVLASAYVSPIIAFGERASKALERLSIHGVMSRVKLNNRLIKLHLRIADYSILDYYDENLKLLERLWKGLSVREFTSLRKDMAVRDSRRYWRLEGKGVKAESTAPHRFLSYVDLVVKAAASKPADLLTKEFAFEDVAAGLVLTPAVTIPEYAVLT